MVFLKIRRERTASSKLLYEVGLSLGNSTELRVDKLLGDIYDKFDWFIRWIKFDHFTGQDRLGIDFIVVTDKGPIFLQVKSGYASVRRFLLRHNNKRFVLLVALPSQTDEEVIAELSSLLQKRYDEM